MTALQAALPTLEGLSPGVVQPLVALESLDDQVLWRVMLETVPLDQQNRLHDLLLRNQAGKLTEAEREQLAIVQQQADRILFTCGRILHLRLVMLLQSRPQPRLTLDQFGGNCRGITPSLAVFNLPMHHQQLLFMILSPPYTFFLN